MSTIIEFINESTVLSQAHLAPIVTAIQDQINDDFGPVWGKSASLSLLSSPSHANPNHWQMIILDNSDQAGALGYHDTTASGQPLGKVFAQTDLTYGSSISVTISHEILEMLADPGINLIALNATGDTEYAYEVADACEDDQFGYKRDGILLSDFVYPAYFIDPPWTPTPRYDQMHHITAPWQVLSGGYMSYRDLTNLSKGWQQVVTADKLTAGRMLPGSRSERRKVIPIERIRSILRY